MIIIWNDNVNLVNNIIANTKNNKRPMTTSRNFENQLKTELREMLEGRHSSRSSAPFSQTGKIQESYNKSKKERKKNKKNKKKNKNLRNVFE